MLLLYGYKITRNLGKSLHFQYNDYHTGSIVALNLNRMAIIDILDWRMSTEWRSEQKRKKSRLRMCDTGMIILRNGFPNGMWLHQDRRSWKILLRMRFHPSENRDGPSSGREQRGIRWDRKSKTLFTLHCRISVDALSECRDQQRWRQSVHEHSNESVTAYLEGVKLESTRVDERVTMFCQAQERLHGLMSLYYDWIYFTLPNRNSVRVNQCSILPNGHRYPRSLCECESKYHDNVATPVEQGFSLSKGINAFTMSWLSTGRKSTVTVPTLHTQLAIQSLGPNVKDLDQNYWNELEAWAKAGELPLELNLKTSR